MNKLEVFKNEEFGEVRTIEQDGIVLFCGSDVAKALGYVRPNEAITQHCKRDGTVFRRIIDGMGREQQAKFINEGNLYRLLINSKLPAAEKFERWVFEEILPSIRKTGAYSMKNYEPKSSSLGEIVNLIKTNCKIMKDQGHSPEAIAKMAAEIYSAYHVYVPDNFVLPASPYQQLTIFIS